ncbi:MAG: CpXC domain-containing protein [Treponema sp.]|nr:CpXC domain-containing protein [Treponema sp.]
MKRKITCFCENAFEVEVPEEINLDSGSTAFDEIQNGTFLNYTCPSCGKKHKPEFPLSVLWPSKKLHFEVFPELDRGEFYRRKKTPVEKGPYTLETIIGYPELADRLAVIRDGFEPVAVEAIKYFLHLKAEEQYPDDEMDIWYFGASVEQAWMEFHIHGIRKEEVAVTKVPMVLYEKNLADYKKHPKGELFSALRVRTYLSVKNMLRPEELK